MVLSWFTGRRRARVAAEPFPEAWEATLRADGAPWRYLDDDERPPRARPLRGHQRGGVLRGGDGVLLRAARDARPRTLTLAALLALGCAASTRARPAAPPPVAAAATPDAAPPAVIDASRPAVDASRPAVDAAPPPPTPEARERAVGSAVFMRVCGPCHLAMWHLPPGGTLSAAGRSEAAVRRLIRAGSGPGSARRMPPLGVDVLPEHELPALFAWLRETGVVGAP